LFLQTKAKSRPYQLGTYPLERLARDDAVIETESQRPRVPAPAYKTAPDGVLAGILRDYLNIFVDNSGADPAEFKAPVPDDPHRRMIDIKGYCNFMNASQVGICRMPDNAWAEGADPLNHSFAIVLVLEQGRLPEADNPARGWVGPALQEAADSRIGGIAVCLSGHIKQLGFMASAHVMDAGCVDMERLAVLAGLAIRRDETLVNPYFDRDFSIAVVTTDYELETDRPLASKAHNAKGLAYWLGQSGATSGRERNRRNSRATHLGDYPMETIKRVDKPTTLILEDEVPQVSKRATFFDRALRGDLGDKSQRERHRFSFKQPHTAGMMPSMRSMVGRQSGIENKQADTSIYNDPDANSRALKSLSHLLGANMTGICEIPRYGWYSHGADGTPITTNHRFAVVMLIDQEFDTMEGASGDDWISGSQSMRAYLRGAEIAGVMAEFLRQLGFASRSQTNVDSEVLQLPLMLLAGLGELSRIGELALNPFVGPRLKTVVVTTDIPLKVDKPIDFGLQTFCNSCLKCARECPCDAISWGDKVMFNGYEIWKPDVERCTRYRLTNAKGSACGRCMKTCPLNKVVTTDGPLVQRLASWCGIHMPVLKPLLVPIAVWLDDFMGNGRRNPVKKWWFDLEVIDGNCVIPVKGINQRELDVAYSIDPKKQKMAYYPASVMPVPNDLRPQPVNRKAAVASALDLETPAAARLRRAGDMTTPEQYIATAENPDGPLGTDFKPSIYAVENDKK
jgi:reductive dehalogenase